MDLSPNQLVNLITQGGATAFIGVILLFLFRYVWPWFTKDWYPDRRKLQAEDMRIRRDQEQQRHADFFSLIAGMNARLETISQNQLLILNGQTLSQKTLEDIRADRDKIMRGIEDSLKKPGV